MKRPKGSAIAPWYGSNRTLAENAGKSLDDCNWIGVPFAGGMCEIIHFKARSIVVNDLHSHIFNLYLFSAPVA